MLSRFAIGLLIGVCIYGYFAIGMPFLLLVSTASFEDGQLKRVSFLGEFTSAGFEIINYEFFLDGELISENDIFSKSFSIKTKKQENGTYTIAWVRYGNQLYEKTLINHPEVLAKAEKILQLGRKGFAEEKKKLERRKLEYRIK